jgi:hypothetical protein
MKIYLRFVKKYFLRLENIKNKEINSKIYS